ncbi:MAG: hypothetical protein IJC48_10675 [Clostridia bacterium]|nr:hypothetical protein [Clostridia bacterium]
MQAVYSTYYNSGRDQKKDAFCHYSKQKDYLVRREKRSPYDDGSKRSSGGGKRGREPGAGVLYMLLTILLLVILYPVGLFFLWARKLNWSVGVKLTLTVLTAVAFCILMVFLINYDTGNPTVKRVQTSMRTVLEGINEYTGEGVEKALAWSKEQYEIGKDTVLKIWDAADEKVAEKALEIYGYVDDSIYQAKVALPRLLLDEYKELTDYKEPENAGTAPKKATPDSGISVNVKSTQAVSVKNTPSPIETPKPELLPTVTPAPTFTPVPTSTPEPIELPEIKKVENAPVYYTKNGTYYHMTSYCSGMMNAVSHTLAEAKAAGKQVCDVCGVVSYAMIDSANYLWVNKDNIAHTSDECIEFGPGKYSVLPFEDVYSGSYSYCTECKADVCREYMKQQHAKYSVNYDEVDDATKRLYDYEMTVTVYYSEHSRQYHANLDCQRMTVNQEKYVHTLYQALHVDNKTRCEKCQPMTEEEAFYQMTAEKNS